MARSPPCDCLSGSKSQGEAQQLVCCMMGQMAWLTRTRIRDQERSPIASDLKRAMREKADLQQPTFALTADVSEAQRQPVHPSDWKFLGCRVSARHRSVGGELQVLLDVSHDTWLPTHRRPGTLLSPGGWRSGLQARFRFILHPMCSCRNTVVVG